MVLFASLAGGAVARACFTRLFSRLPCACERTWLRGLRRVFGFGAWHVSAAYSCRAYKGVVVELVNSLRPVTVVEVGCGLGDILSHVRAAQRFGFDTDSSVIRAAQFLHPGAGKWIHGDAASILRVMPSDGRIDCLIMVNWIHNLSPEQLAAGILPLLPRTAYLVLDAIDAHGPASYRFRHDFAFLAPFTERLSVTRVAGEPRSFSVFKVTA